jgi:hypothetical protein
MSKTLALLKSLEDQRAGKKDESRKNAAPACPANGGVPRTVRAISAKAISFWIISVIIVLLLLILLIFDQKLFTMIKENTAENFSTGEKLNKIESILTDYSRQANVNRDVIKKLSDILESLDTRLKDTEEKLTQFKDITEEKITQLKETADTQVSAIQLLTKEKDKLLDKISSLETEVDKFKAENATHAAAVNVTTATTVIE